MCTKTAASGCEGCRTFRELRPIFRVCIKTAASGCGGCRTLRELRPSSECAECAPKQPRHDVEVVRRFGNSAYLQSVLSVHQNSRVRMSRLSDVSGTRPQSSECAPKQPRQDVKVVGRFGNSAPIFRVCCVCTKTAASGCVGCRTFRELRPSSKCAECAPKQPRQDVKVVGHFGNSDQSSECAECAPKQPRQDVEVAGRFGNSAHLQSVHQNSRVRM